MNDESSSTVTRPPDPGTGSYGCAPGAPRQMWPVGVGATPVFDSLVREWAETTRQMPQAAPTYSCASCRLPHPPAPWGPPTP
ncbi:hypothetical protein [Embleya sp. NPDC005575]|uniref:hypothetical protein n=1 Tax=Embleya sp. NPDC005575 TaxID=3156892 RepID=UPI0033A9B7EC